MHKGNTVKRTITRCYIISRRNRKVTGKKRIHELQTNNRGLNEQIRIY